MRLESLITNTLAFIAGSLLLVLLGGFFYFLFYPEYDMGDFISELFPFLVGFVLGILIKCINGNKNS